MSQDVLAFFRFNEAIFFQRVVYQNILQRSFFKMAAE